ncbi:rCG21526 [Rattus norvegicus]|uniref:RCG21526 n=1 Tax=Rattus norvegicus TaxID=10116 RepID=A6J0U8_RAT|nr:rCG21526 [Rattus norvegicus]
MKSSTIDPRSVARGKELEATCLQQRPGSQEYKDTHPKVMRKKCN